MYLDTCRYFFQKIIVNHKLPKFFDFWYQKTLKRKQITQNFFLKPPSSLKREKNAQLFLKTTLIHKKVKKSSSTNFLEYLY